MRWKTLALLLVVIVLVSVLGIWMKDLVKPPAPAEYEEEVVFFADALDCSEASELIDHFRDGGFEVVLAKATDFSRYKDYGLIIFVGGPYSQEGVWNEIKNLLTEEEQEHLKTPNHMLALVKNDVWREGQQVTIYAGSDRDETKKAWLRTTSPPELSPFKGPPPPEGAVVIPIAFSSSNSSPSLHYQNPSCTPEVGGKLGTGAEAPDAFGRMLDIQNFPEFVDIRFHNFLSIIPDPLRDLANIRTRGDLIRWVAGKLQSWASDFITNIFTITIRCGTCGYENTLVVNIDELKGGYARNLQGYITSIGNMAGGCPNCGVRNWQVAWNPVPDSTLDSLKNELLGTEDLKEFLDNFAGLKTSFTSWPWDAGLLVFPCTSQSTPPPFMIGPIQVPVAFDWTGSSVSYTSWNFETNDVSWNALPEDMESVGFFWYMDKPKMDPNPPPPYEWRLIDKFYYFIEHNLLAWTDPWSGSYLPGTAWYQLGDLGNINPPPFIDVGGTRYDRKIVNSLYAWMVDGVLEYTVSSTYCIAMDSPHKVVALYGITPSPPDLKISKVFWVPTSPVATGSTITVYVVVENAGGQDAGPFDVDVNFAGTSLGTQSISGLAAWHQQPLTFTIDSSLTQSAGDYTITATADINDDVDEGPNEGNNDLTDTIKIIDAPDLLVEDIFWTPLSPTAGQTITATVVVGNNGTAPAGPFDVEARFDGKSLGTQGVPGLAAKASINLQFTIDPSLATPGIHDIFAYADWNDRVKPEPNEGNNEYSEEIFIGESGAQSNLMNGDFEDWNSVPTYWLLEGGTVHRSTLAYFGSYSVKLGGETEQEAGWDQYTVLSQTFQVTPGAKCALLFYAFGDNQWGSFSARVEVVWLGEDLAPISTVSSPNIATSSTWQAYEISLNAPSMAAYARVRLVKASWGFVFFDRFNWSVET